MWAGRAAVRRAACPRLAPRREVRRVDPGAGAGLGLFARGADEHDRALRLSLAGAHDPCDPVRSARSALNLERRLDSGHGHDPIRFGRDWRAGPAPAKEVIAPAEFNLIESSVCNLAAPGWGEGVSSDVDLSELRQRSELSSEDPPDARGAPRGRPRGSVRREPPRRARSALRRVRIGAQLRGVRGYASQGSAAHDRGALTPPNARGDAAARSRL